MSDAVSRAMSRLSRIASACGIGCVATLLAFAYWWPAFRAVEATGFGDWQMIHHNWEVGLVAWTRHHELPLFDPYHCGGVTMLGNPESQVFSPLFALAFGLGTTLATKVFIALHTAAALLGSVHYARRVAGLSWPASTLSAVVFAGSGFFAWHLAGGHATFAPFAFLPWLHVALCAAEKSPRAAVLGGLLLALTIAEGGTYPFPYMLVSLGVAATSRSIASPESTPRILRGGLVMGLVSLGAAAFRIGPIRETLARLPRTIASADASSFADVWMMLTARDHDWGVPGHEFVWPEYCTYVGYGVLACVAVGALRGCRKTTRPLVVEHLVGALVAILLMQGNASGFHPWVLLRHLPVYDSLRVPSRFGVILTFHLGVVAGVGLDVLDARASRGGRRVARLAFATLTLVAIATDLVLVTRPIVDRWTYAPIDGTSIASTLRFRDSLSYGDVYASLPRRNEATTLCYVGGMNWVVSPAIRLGDVPQAWTQSVDASVRVVTRTPNHAVLHVTAPRATRVVLNQNFDPGFVPNYGRISNVDGLLGVDVPRGRRTLDVRFRPPSLAPSFAVTCVALLCSALVFARLRRWPTLADALEWTR